MIQSEPSTGTAGRDPDRPAPSATVWVLVVVLAAAAFGTALAVRHTVFPYYSGDHDEPVYRFQAQMLEHGQVTLPRSQERFYRPWLSGPHGDHLVMAFPPGWPAVLAGSDLITGSMAPALGFAAALAAIGAFLLTNELLRSPPRALLAAALVSFSPFVVMLSGTYLDYVWALGLELVFSFLLLRGARTGSLVTVVAGGAIWGITFMTRTYDAVLVLLPVAAYVVWTSRRDGHRLLRVTLAAAAGVAPFLVLTGVYNVLIAGSPLRFSTVAQSQNVARFGWGRRGIGPGLDVIRFTPTKAVTSLGQNLWGLPTWLLGTYVALVLAGVGIWRLRRDRPTLWLLIGMLVVVPVGYLAWFASAYTAKSGVFTGLGPHYYVPMVAPLAMLTAEGVAALWERRTAWVAVTAVAAVAVTAVFIPSKLHDKRKVNRESRSFERDVRRGIASAGDRKVLVVIERAPNPYLMQPFPYLANTPRLDGRILYALDRGAAVLDLVREQSGRVPFRIVRQFVAGRTGVPAVLERITSVSAPVLTVRAHLVNTSGTPNVVAYLGGGNARDRRLLDRSSTRGKTYDVAWTIAADGSVRYDGPPAPSLGASPTLPRTGVLTVGIATGNDLVPANASGAERRYYFRLQDGEVQVVTAGEQWVHFAGPHGGYLPGDVGPSLTVSFSPG